MSDPRVAYSIAHAQHETLHNFLFIFLFFFLILSQLGLFLWKKHYYRSFQNVTLLGLWLIPFVLSLWSKYILHPLLSAHHNTRFYRMLLVWIAFSSITLYLIIVASKSPVPKEVPKRVYGWFFLVYRLSYGLTILGYAVVMLELLGVSHVLGHQLPLGYAGGLMLFYGLYYGVLGRDFAEMCTDRLASVMGFTGKGLPSKIPQPRTCCICGDEYALDDSVRLNCYHQFHEWCLRGWTMIGKKDTCPFCSEKVQHKFSSNPWERGGVLWANLLDALRYLIVWNPIILSTVQLILYFIDPGA